MELFLYFAAATILTPFLQGMGVPWSVRLVIYLTPASILLLYNWLHRAARKAKADEELTALVGSVETVKALREKYPALDWSFRNHNCEMVAKIATHTRETGRITDQQEFALHRAVAQWVSPLRAPGPEAPVEPLRCPQCSTFYDPRDYRADATTIYCSTCQAPMPR